MISYFFQVTLSNRLKYKSLYEAQVPTRDDSPAHYLGEIQKEKGTQPFIFFIF